MKTQADAHRRDSDLAEGQRVWLSTAHLPLKEGTRKLAEKWIGPYRIAARVTREAWRRSLPPLQGGGVVLGLCPLETIFRHFYLSFWLEFCGFWSTQKVSDKNIKSFD